jgi:hypothetical protein
MSRTQANHLEGKKHAVHCQPRNACVTQVSQVPRYKVRIRQEEGGDLPV